MASRMFMAALLAVRALGADLDFRRLMGHAQLENRDLTPAIPNRKSRSDPSPTQRQIPEAARPVGECILRHCNGLQALQRVRCLGAPAKSRGVPHSDR